MVPTVAKVKSPQGRACVAKPTPLSLVKRRIRFVRGLVGFFSVAGTAAAVPAGHAVTPHIGTTTCRVRRHAKRQIRAGINAKEAAVKRAPRAVQHATLIVGTLTAL